MESLRERFAQELARGGPDCDPPCALLRAGYSGANPEAAARYLMSDPAFRGQLTLPPRVSPEDIAASLLSIANGTAITTEYSYGRPDENGERVRVPKKSRTPTPKERLDAIALLARLTGAFARAGNSPCALPPESEVIPNDP